MCIIFSKETLGLTAPLPSTHSMRAIISRIEIERDRDRERDFKELSYIIIMEAGKSKIFRLDW